MTFGSRLLSAALLAFAASCSGSGPAPTVVPVALAPAPADSAAPERPTTDLEPRDFGATNITARERREWSKSLAELRAPCPGVDASIAACVTEKRACPACAPAAKMLLRQVLAGRARAERAEAFQARFDPTRVRAVAIDGAPSRGPQNAVVTVVVWLDFECPFCRTFSPVLDELVRRFPGKVRLVERVYPLPTHPHADGAACAAMASDKQGKYWEMRDLLFADQEHLEPRDLVRRATSLKLDVPRFTRDAASAEIAARVAKDRRLGDELGLDGTPYLFVNGRRVDLMEITNPLVDLEEWVTLEIQLAEAR